MSSDSKWTSKVRPSAAHNGKQSFHHAQTSLVAHWIREAGILAPLVISEFVEDFKQQRRWIRMASVGTALLTQGEYTYRVHKEREEAKAQQEERCPA